MCLNAQIFLLHNIHVFPIANQDILFIRQEFIGKTEQSVGIWGCPRKSGTSILHFYGPINFQKGQRMKQNP